MNAMSQEDLAREPLRLPSPDFAVVEKRGEKAKRRYHERLVAEIERINAQGIRGPGRPQDERPRSGGADAPATGEDAIGDVERLPGDGPEPRAAAETHAAQVDPQRLSPNTQAALRALDEARELALSTGMRSGTRLDLERGGLRISVTCADRAPSSWWQRLRRLRPVSRSR